MLLVISWSQEGHFSICEPMRLPKDHNPHSKGNACLFLVHCHHKLCGRIYLQLDATVDHQGHQLLSEEWVGQKSPNILVASRSLSLSASSSSSKEAGIFAILDCFLISADRQVHSSSSGIVACLFFLIVLLG